MRTHDRQSLAGLLELAPPIPSPSRVSTPLPPPSPFRQSPLAHRDATGTGRIGRPAPRRGRFRSGRRRSGRAGPPQASAEKRGWRDSPGALTLAEPYGIVQCTFINSINVLNERGRHDSRGAAQVRLLGVLGACLATTPSAAGCVLHGPQRARARRRPGGFLCCAEWHRICRPATGSAGGRSSQWAKGGWGQRQLVVAAVNLPEGWVGWGKGKDGE